MSLQPPANNGIVISFASVRHMRAWHDTNEYKDPFLAWYYNPIWKCIYLVL